MHTRASNSKLVEPLPEPERTLNRRLSRRNKRVLFDQRNNPPQHPRIIYPLILNIIYFRRFFDILRNYDPMDDEPMWAVDHVNAPTPGSAITIPETINEFAIKAGAIFLYKTPNQAYQLLKDKVLLKLDWAKNQKTKSSLKKTIAFADEGSSNSDTDKITARMDAMTIKMDAQYKKLQSIAKQSTPDHDDEDMPMSREEKAKFMQTFLDFVILEIEDDSKVPLILRRPFLHTVDAVIRVKQKQIHLGVEEDLNAHLDEGSKIFHTIEGTLLEKEIFFEFDEFMAMAADENSESEYDIEELCRNTLYH
nr:reverse transcriptase domain-containing protein [Tanacetum cinerariifolium]